MGLKPAFLLTANGEPITDTIQNRLISLRVTLETEHQSDELEVQLVDSWREQPIIKPKPGALLTLALGYLDDGQPFPKLGDFVLSRLSGSGGKGTVQTFTLHARAAPYAGTPRGETDFQTQKTRSWRAGTTIGAMVQKMAKEHGMGAEVSPELQQIHLQHFDQTEEADISFLQRLARQYDAIAKPMGGKLLFLSRGASRSASGKALPVVPLSASQVSSWHWDEDRHAAPGTVVALYHATTHAQTRAVSIGTGDPVRRLKRKYRTAEDARAAATAEMGRRARGAMKLTLTMPGAPTISSESTLKLDKTFGQGTDGLWLVKRVTHSLTKSGGFTTEVECDRPNNDPAVAAYLAGPVQDKSLTKA